jgi:hypothetical protein
MKHATFDDIRGNGWLYTTARIATTGQFVQLLGILFEPPRFIVATQSDPVGKTFEVPWEHLDSICL